MVIDDVIARCIEPAQVVVESKGQVTYISPGVEVISGSGRYKIAEVLHNRTFGDVAEIVKLKRDVEGVRIRSDADKCD